MQFVASRTRRSDKMHTLLLRILLKESHLPPKFHAHIHTDEEEEIRKRDMMSI